jgi:alpha-N-arabinofuranosidase
MMKPQGNVLLANYWQCINGYWGMIRRSGGSYRLMPPYYLFRLWGEHFGDVLVDVAVAGPKVTFEGFGSVSPSIGRASRPEERMADVNLYEKGRLLTSPAGSGRKYDAAAGVQWTGRDDGVLEFRLNSVRNHQYQDFALVQRGAIPKKYRPDVFGIRYRVTFEAEWKPAPGTGPAMLGMSLMDGRGWKVAGSAAEIHGIEQATAGWKTFSMTYTPLKDTPSLLLTGRFLAGSDPVSGVVRIRNIRIEPWRSSTVPTYDGLTAAASRSADGKTLYLMVFNKMLDEKLPARIRLEGFDAASAHYWEVNGPDIGAVDDVKETVSGKALRLGRAGEVRHVFPAHSMTALEIKRRKTR